MTREFMEKYGAPVLAKAEAESASLRELCKYLHSHPELGFQEHEASARLTAYLEEKGFSVQRGCAGLPTAFTAVKEGRPGGPSIGFFCEYDALPSVGHACGHNIIATIAVGGAVAAAEALADFPGRIVVLGTPSEEGAGGGKIRMLEAGVMDGLDCGMMLHPGSSTVIKDKTLAISAQRFIYHGRAAHAGAAQEAGRNAVEAVVQLFNGINSLRGHLKKDVNIHGIILEGGVATNIVPDRAVAEFGFRAKNKAELDDLLERARGCAEGAALMTGCTVEIEPVGLPYLDLVPNDVIQGVIAEAMEELQVPIDVREAPEGLASTDLGNVSHVLPAVQVMLGVGEDALPHTAPFAEICGGDRGADLAMRGVRVLALSGARLLAEPGLVDAAGQELRRRKAL